MDTSSNCAALKTGTCSDAATEASFDGDDAHESRSHGDAALVGFITINQGVEERTARLEEQSTCSNHILHKLRGVIPSSWIPDRLVIVKDIPVTTHGRWQKKCQSDDTYFRLFCLFLVKQVKF